MALGRMDYGRTIPAGRPRQRLDRLRHIMNDAAVRCCTVRSYDHITPLFRDLHWLLATQRIRVPSSPVWQFALSVASMIMPSRISRCISTTTLIGYRPTWHSTDDSVNQSISGCAFPVTAAHVSNSLSPARYGVDFSVIF